MYLPLNEPNSPSPFLFSVTIPKRNHRNASVRNLLKRRIREAWRQNKPSPVIHKDDIAPFALMYILIDKEVTTSATIQRAIERLHRKFDRMSHNTPA